MNERKSEGAEAYTRIATVHRPLLSACYLLLAALCSACSTEHPAAPSLSDSLMVEVLAEVHLADARAAHTGESRDSLRAEALAPFDLDTLAFQQALDYYAEHPDAYAPLYARALDQLIRERRLE